MIEKQLKTLDGKLNVSIPSHLNEVTLGQMMQMQEAPQLSDIAAISILSGLPVEDLQNVINIKDLDLFGEAVLSLSNQIKYLYNSDEIPKKVSFIIYNKKVSVDVCRNLSVEPAGAFMAARDIIADEIAEHIKHHGEENWQEQFNPSIKACCQVLAQYFYCPATGNRYNEYKAEAFSETVKKLGVLEALPIARYFFMNYPNLSRPRTNYFLRFRQFWKRKQVSHRSKNSSI